MTQTIFPRPPSNKGGTLDPFEFSKWLDRIWQALSGATGIAWRVIDKAGSRLSEIEDRPHSDLSQIKPADTSSDDATADRHISDAQGKAWDQQGADILAQGIIITAQGATLDAHIADDTVHHLAAAASADVASADAGVIYTAAEQDLVNELKTSLNDLKAQLRAVGMLTP